jgi:hypothetical protein
MADCDPTNASQELASRLAALDATAQELNQASNSINATLNAIEKVLGGINVGLEIWLSAPLTRTDAEGSMTTDSVWIEQRLGYARINGKWCLAVKRLRFHSGFFEGDRSCPFQNEFRDGPEIPLAQASREARIEALGMLSELVALLDSAAKAKLAKIKESESLLIQ